MTDSETVVEWIVYNTLCARLTVFDADNETPRYSIRMV